MVATRRDIPEAWFRLPIFYFSNPSEIRGPDDPIWAPRDSEELDYELEVAALIDTPAIDLAPERAEEAFGGYMVFGDWSARDLQRDETAVRLGPAKGKDFASSFGPWLVTPDELVDRRAGTRLRPGHGRPGQRCRDVARSLERRGPRPGRPARHGRVPTSTCDRATCSGSGTVGGGCLLEVREATIGRYLEPGDVVELEVERLGVLRTSDRGATSLKRTAPDMTKPALPSEPASWRQRACDRGRR